MKIQTNNQMGTKNYIAKFRTSFLLLCLLALGLTLSTGTGRFTPSAQAKAATTASMAVTLTPEQMEAAVEEYFASIASLDVQRYVNNFAANGVLEDPVGTPPVQGTQAIAGYFGAIIAPFSHIKAKVQEVIPCGQEAAVNWKLNLTRADGKKIQIDGMGVFKFDQTGKLASVREFWDLAAFLAQMQN